MFERETIRYTEWTYVVQVIGLRFENKHVELERIKLCVVPRKNARNESAMRW